MAYLTAAVILVGVLCLLNLVLTLGVIRRLREHSEQLSAAGGAGPKPILSAGEPIGEFEATTADGAVVSRSTLLDGESHLVGFFSVNCQFCKEQLPRFVEYARGVAGGRQRVLAVVVDDGDTSELVSALDPVARLVLEPHDGPLATAFGVTGSPAFCRVAEDGTVADSGYDLRALMASAPA